MLSTITSKGQVTIPVAIRKRYGLRPSDKIDFVAQEDKILLVPVRTLRDFRGSVAGGGTPDRERQSAREAVGTRVVEEME